MMRMETKSPWADSAQSFWAPMAPWIDMGLRALDLSMSVTQSWHQWLTGQGTLFAAEADPAVDPTAAPMRPVRVRSAREHAVAQREPKRATRGRGKARGRARD
jgi:hypothetical protein